MPSKHKKTKLTVSLDVIPIKKQKQSYCNFLDIVEVQVPHLCIGVPTRADKPESPYLKPIIDEFEMDISGELSASWKVLKLLIEKVKNSDGCHSFVPKSPGSRIPWNIFFCTKMERASIQNLLENIYQPSLLSLCKTA